MAKKLALLGILTALMPAFAYAELCLPGLLPLPGYKPGLSNLVLLFALYCMSRREAFMLLGLKIVLFALLFASPMGAVYSLFGGTLSLCGMSLARGLRGLSPVGVSVLGALLHNVGQLAAAVLLLGSLHVLRLAPLLLAAGAATGFVVGLAAQLAIAWRHRLWQ